MADFSIEAVRERFPALALTDQGRRRIYLDNPAGTQVPRAVADAVSRCLLTTNANLGGFFETAVAAQQVVDDAHTAMADFLGAASVGEIIIGANMTTLTYHMSRTLGRTMKPGDEIILTRMDHEGNVAPWLQLAEDLGLVVRFLPFDEQSWQVEESALQALLSQKTRLVALNYASNLTGSINRVKALTAIAKQAGALVYVDAVQFAPHGLIDVQALGCDFLACSAYKFFGPHVGVLWGRRNLLEQLEAYKVRPAPMTPPDKWMTGTQRHEAIAGALAAVEYLADLGRTLAGNDSLPRRAALREAYREIGLYERALAGRSR